MKTASALLVSLALLSTTAALAHTDEYLDTQAAPNGGQLRMAGAYHYELVVAKNGTDGKESPVTVYVTDHAGAKVATVGGGGTTTLLAGKTKTTVTLTPDGDNRLKGVGKYVSSPDLKAIVSITLPGKTTEQARFTPLAKAAKDEHAAHAH